MGDITATRLGLARLYRVTTTDETEARAVARDNHPTAGTGERVSAAVIDVDEDAGETIVAVTKEHW